MRTLTHRPFKKFCLPRKTCVPGNDHNPKIPHPVTHTIKIQTFRFVELVSNVLNDRDCIASLCNSNARPEPLSRGPRDGLPISVICAIRRSIPLSILLYGGINSRIIYHRSAAYSACVAVRFPFSPHAVIRLYRFAP